MKGKILYIASVFVHLISVLYLYYVLSCYTHSFQKSSKYLFRSVKSCEKPKKVILSQRYAN